MPTDRSQGKVLVDIEPLMIATRTINALIVRSMAAVDTSLSVPQLRVMVILTRVGRASLSDVAERLGVNASNASRVSDQLVKRRLVRREEDPDDRRRVVLTLSPSGRKVLARVMERRRVLLEEVVTAMSPPEQDLLMDALGPFNAASEATGASDAAGESEGHRLGPWLG